MVTEGLVFGWRSALLLALLAPLLPLGIGLTRTLRNRIANRTLTLLLLVLAGIATPWMIGFAGFYDRWQALSYVPFSLSLAVPPLLWFYTRALVHGAWPPRALWHLVPAALEATAKIAQIWTGYHPTIGTLTDIALAVSSISYGTLSLRTLRDYRALLEHETSDASRHAADWLRRAIMAVLVLLAIAFGYKLAGLFVPLGYKGTMGLHVFVAAFALYLGVEGWRHAALAHPLSSELIHEPPVERPPERDWRALGSEIEQRVRKEGWATDPELSLARLARLLGTNRNYVSRALNEGLGQSFAAFVNGLRCEAIAERMREGSRDTLLDLALEAGFTSKATFNRAFIARFGCAPSTWRARLES